MDVSTCIWFDGNIEEAARFYVSLVPGSEVGSISRYPEGSEFPGGTPGDALTLDFTLAGVPYQLLNGGPEFPLTEAVSIALIVDDQDEVDRYWEALTDGGDEIACGWLSDRFGLGWQVVPNGFTDYLNDPDPARSQAAMRAMFGMKKLDLAALQAAADAAGAPATA